ncbi:type II secretion system protein GspG [Pseudomarimonas salicorniae]|uniref:Type II secretion system protein GspG n=1 Tax=Pseudomarimonas salicorniae TaxID=2933270 RepID=A0ABT0GEQ0_9GAMM|nr:type II secretion system protein GspG [Lysobacter sp. CAU 1642]MCK7593029.1 type II secretion system protein GspG [Lysobacter sp. CAU 1642]
MAFTLIELLLALGAAAAVALIAVPMYRDAVDKARTSRAVADIAEISMALERRRTVLGRWPPTLDDLPGNPPLIDPWGRPYRYLAIAVKPPPPTGKVRRDKNLNPLNRDFDLYSTGPDGETQTQLTARKARDDIVRAGNGSFIGRAEDH